jgi:hypothetical protein
MGNAELRRLAGSPTRRPAVLPQTTAVLLVDQPQPGYFRQPPTGSENGIAPRRHACRRRPVSVRPPLPWQPGRHDRRRGPADATHFLRCCAVCQSRHAGCRPDFAGHPVGCRRPAASGKGQPLPRRPGQDLWLRRARHPRQGSDRHRIACRRAVALAALAQVMALPAGNALAFRMPALSADRATLVFLDAAAVSWILRLFLYLPSFPALLGSGIQQPGGFLVLYSGHFLGALPWSPWFARRLGKACRTDRSPAACAA